MTALLCTLQNPTNQEAEGRAAPHRADTAQTARAHSPVVRFNNFIALVFER